MGWRFRRSVRLLPGVRVNLSKTGASLSIGGPGATMNFGKRGVRSTVGLPGTGISYTTKVAGERPPAGPGPRQASPNLSWLGWGAAAIAALWVASTMLR